MADLKTLIQNTTNTSQATWQLSLRGELLNDDKKTLRDLTLQYDESVVIKPLGTASTAPTTNTQQSAAGMDRMEMMRTSLLTDPRALQSIRSQNPELAEAVNDPQRFRTIAESIERTHRQRESERLEQYRLLEEDPFNIEAQQKIEEIIRQEAVMQNMQHAMEYTPEGTYILYRDSAALFQSLTNTSVFGNVHMLYIEVLVNSIPVKAFVDSGAQTTVMSPACAENCGIMRLIDKRFAGIARGVGTAKILGRVHSAPIKIGTATMPCSFTVMEGKDVDLLLGLDMLKRYQANIDLKNNKLVLGDTEVTFLSESEIPKNDFDGSEEVKGQDGAVIDASTGTVKQAPAGTTTQPPPAGLPAAAALPAPAASTSSNRPAAATHDQDKINQLVSLGFSADQANAALDATDGNVEYAAGLLFQG